MIKNFVLNDFLVERLHELADLQHPHMKGDNYTRLIIDKVYYRSKLTPIEYFDCGKYYQRMLEQLEQFKENRELHSEYLNAILCLKWAING